MKKTLFEYWKEGYTVHYLDFDGRARRSEFWGIVLLNLFAQLLVHALFFLLTDMLGGTLAIVFMGVVLLAMMPPYLSAVVRRLHDTGRSGWTILIALVPLLGTMIVVAWLFSDSLPYVNQYGENPKGQQLNIIGAD